jgi:hypothetical protein
MICSPKSPRGPRAAHACGLVFAVCLSLALVQTSVASDGSSVTVHSNDGVYTLVGPVGSDGITFTRGGSAGAALPVSKDYRLFYFRLRSGPTEMFVKHLAGTCAEAFTVTYYPNGGQDATPVARGGNQDGLIGPVGQVQQATITMTREMSPIGLEVGVVHFGETKDPTCAVHVSFSPTSQLISAPNSLTAPELRTVLNRYAP